MERAGYSCNSGPILTIYPTIPLSNSILPSIYTAIDSRLLPSFEGHKVTGHWINVLISEQDPATGGGMSRPTESDPGLSGQLEKSKNSKVPTYDWILEYPSASQDAQEPT